MLIDNLKVTISGIRGLSPQFLDGKATYVLVSGFSTMLPARSLVVMSRDNRETSLELYNSAKRAFLDAGCEVFELGIAPLPTLAIAIKSRQAVGGVMITASHNPSEYNGLKFLDYRGRYLDEDKVNYVASFLSKGDLQIPEESSKFVLGSDFQSALDIREAGLADHIARVSELVIEGKELVIAVDAVNGSASDLIVRFLEQHNCKVLKVATDSTQPFPHIPEPTPENLTWTREQLSGADYDVCVVIDPDGDRLTLIDELGNILSEELTLPLLVDNFLAENKTGKVVVNLSTSTMIDKVIAKANLDIKVIRSAVGEANVSTAIEKEKAFFGGEGNGGVIDPRVHLGRDALTGIAHLITLLRRHSEKKLSNLVAEIPVLHMKKTKFSVAGLKDIGTVVANVLATISDKPEISSIDGYYLNWPSLNNSWVHLRLSNTEPIARLIGESGDAKWLDDIITKFNNEFYG